MHPYLEITKPKVWTLVGFFVLIGALISGGINDPRVYAAVVSAVLTAAGGMVANDYIDRKKDSVHSRHRPIPSGRIDPKYALYHSVALLLIGFLVSTYISPIAIIISFIGTIFVLTYSTHFRYYHVFGNFIVSYLMGSAFLYGGAATGNIQPALFLAAFITLANTSREILKDVSNYKRDRAFGTKTIPVLYSVSYARSVASIFMLSSVAILPLTYYYGVFGQTFLATSMGSAAIFLYSIYQSIRNSKSEKVGYEISWAMALGVIAFVVGSLI